MQLMLTITSFILTVICLCATPYYFNRKMKVVALIYFLLTVMNVVSFVKVLQ